MTTLVLLAFFSAVGSSILGFADAQEVYSITMYLDDHQKGTLVMSDDFATLYIPWSNGIWERRFKGETNAGIFTGVWRYKGEVISAISVYPQDKWGILQNLGPMPLSSPFTLD